MLEQSRRYFILGSKLLNWIFCYSNFNMNKKFWHTNDCALVVISSLLTFVGCWPAKTKWQEFHRKHAKYWVTFFTIFAWYTHVADAVVSNVRIEYSCKMHDFVTYCKKPSLRAERGSLFGLVIYAVVFSISWCVRKLTRRNGTRNSDKP